MEIVTHVALWLIVYRISTDIAWMDGPMDAFAHFRGAIISRFGSSHWLSVGVQCPICISFWVASILAIAMLDWRVLAGAGFTTLAIRWSR